MGEHKPKREFRNLREVAEYLKASGWKVSQSTVYKHGGEGKIRPNQEGVYSLKAVEKYAGIFLVRKETQQKIIDDELQRKKLLAEVEKLSEQARLARIKRLAEEGRYILRDDLELEMAARAASLEAGLKHIVQLRAGDWISVVTGDGKKTGDLIREMNKAIDLILNEFASMREFHIILESTV
jgi:hypothetical protein